MARSIGDWLRTPRPWLVVLTLSFLLIDAYILFQGRNLRLGSDDYCLSADAYRGLFGEIVFWWSSTSGFLYSGFLGSLLVGLPGLHLPWQLASLVPFAVTSITVGLSVLVCLWRIPGRTSGRVLAWLGWSVLVAAGGLAAWWAFLWWPLATDETSRSALFALGLTHWQTINAVYVVQTATLLIAGLISWWGVRGRRWWPLILAGFTGLAAGFSGPSTVLTVVLFVVIVGVYGFVARVGSIRSRAIWLAIMGVTAVTGGLISQMAPGTQSRRSVLGSSEHFTPTKIGEILHLSVPSFILEWLQAYWHVGSLAVVAVFLPIAWSAARLRPALHQVGLVHLGLVVAGLGLLASFSAKAGEQFAYEGYWHFVPVRFLAFLSLACFSAAGGIAVAQRSAAAIQPVVIALLGLGVLVMGGSAMEMATHIASRAAQWSVGGATVKNGTVADIDSFDWVLECWNRLGQLRDVPDRTGGA